MSIVASGLTNPNTSLNNGKKIVIDSNGILYCCFYTQVGSYNQIFVYKSEDDGNTWVDMNFPQITEYNQFNPSIVIDSNNKLHVTWYGYDASNTGYTQIKYSNNINESWSSWINIQTIINYAQYAPSIGIDSNNKIHITWRGLDSSNPSNTQIKYSNNITGSWGNWINIQTISGYSQLNPSIVIDNNNKCYITWHGKDSNNSSYYQIKYSNNVNGSWSSWINIQVISGYNQTAPNIAIDSNNKIHIVWQGMDSNNPSYYQIKYSNNINGNWINWINIQSILGYNQYAVSMSIDKNNKCHITWQGTDSSNTSYSQIKYSNNIINGNWSTYINKTNGTINYQNSSCIFKNNNLYCVYSSNTTIEFFSIAFISNKYLIQDGDRIKTSTDRINLIDLGTSYNKDTFNTYGMNNLNNLNSTILGKIINNEYKILMYKVK